MPTPASPSLQFAVPHLQSISLGVEASSIEHGAPPLQTPLVQNLPLFLLHTELVEVNSSVHVQALRLRPDSHAGALHWLFVALHNVPVNSRLQSEVPQVHLFGFAADTSSLLHTGKLLHLLETARQYKPGPLQVVAPQGHVFGFFNNPC